MSLSIPLSVRLSTSRGYADITDQVRDLSFGWTDPGGYASCRVSLDRPLSIQPDEIAYYGQMVVYDARNASVEFDGRLEDPGRSAGRDGQVWDLVAMGGQAHTKDRTVPYIAVDRPLSGFERVDNFTPGGRDSVSVDPGDSAGLRQALVLQFPQGLSIPTDARVVMRYNGIQRAGQKLARVAFTWDVGFTSASVLVEALARTDGSLAGWDTAVSVGWDTAGGTAAAVVGSGSGTLGSGRNTLDLRMRYTSTAGSVTTDAWWASFYNIAVRSLLLDKTGTEITTGYTANTVLASEVVADLLGRLLTAYDGANATIATTTQAIDQLAYPDGVDANKVLTDLMTLESGFTWRVWERNSAGKFRFEWVPVPNAVRYEADILDGYDSTGSSDGLYNQVTVRGRDTAGNVKTVTRTATVPELDAAGLIRTPPPLDLGDEVWSTANANRAGDQFLADHRYPPNAGRLRIARKILDLQTGMMVDPWEIRPGLIRVRGIRPRIDALNATTRDGVTVFRIVASEYNVSDAAATLELDSYAPSTARALADLSNRPVYRRR